MCEHILGSQLCTAKNWGTFMWKRFHIKNKQQQKIQSESLQSIQCQIAFWPLHLKCACVMSWCSPGGNFKISWQRKQQLYSWSLPSLAFIYLSFQTAPRLDNSAQDGCSIWQTLTKNKLLTLDGCFLLTWPLAAGGVALCCSILFHSAVGAHLSRTSLVQSQGYTVDWLPFHHNHPPF